MGPRTFSYRIRRCSLICQISLFIFLLPSYIPADRLHWQAARFTFGSVEIANQPGQTNRTSTLDHPGSLSARFPIDIMTRTSTTTKSTLSTISDKSYQFAFNAPEIVEPLSLDDQPLPNELLRQVFLCLDPHTLFTSIRALNWSWKKAVEEELLEEQFKTKTWRVALRVTKKAPLRVPGAATEAETQTSLPAAVNSQEGPTAAESPRTREARLRRQDEEMQALLATPNTTDQDVAALANSFHAAQIKANRPIAHYIPLEFQRYKGDKASLSFSTGNEWHALFDGFTDTKAMGTRLDLDFGLCWRFPGDGQDEEDDATSAKDLDEQDRQAKYWGTPDVENGWLSRFYCVS